MNKIITASCFRVDNYVANNSVNCIITSPPYYGLRDYGVDGQIGLEQTPQEYVDRLVSLFSICRGLLRDDGTLWLNLGDSYAAANSGNHGYIDGRTNRAQRRAAGLPGGSIKPKDLIGIPWRVAFALQADGWYLRQDIIWHKPNPMPESVRDRCTKSHEYLFLFSKSPRYYFDYRAIKEPCSDISKQRVKYGWDCDRPSTKNAAVGGRGIHVEKMGSRFCPVDGRNKRDVWTVATQPYKGAHFATYPPELVRPCVLAGCPKDGVILDPFMGAGTTALVAAQEDRKYIGIEINPAYVKLAQERLINQQLGSIM